MSEYLSNARIHIDDDQAVLLFELENEECGLVIDIDFMDCLTVSRAGGISVLVPTGDSRERNADEYE